MPISWDDHATQGRRPEQEAASEAVAAWCLAIAAMLLVGRLIFGAL